MKKFILLLLAVCLFGAAWSQTRQIKGKVTDENGAAISGVSVVSRGVRTGTQTNATGNFVINVTADKTDLTFTYVGYTAKTVNAAAGSTITVQLVSAANSDLNDVVVVGYQTVRRKDVLASIASVGAKDLKDIPITSAAEALNGRLAGVTATTAEGSPDADVRIRVRGGMSITGDNSPLYIIDGVQVENGLSAVSPQDIQNIDVLKDAAATAIYGARGGNGVIIITTKGGRKGRLSIGYNGYGGIKKLAKELDVLSPYDYVIYQSERSRGSSTDSTTFTNNFGHTWDTLNNYKNVSPVDWQKETFGRIGITTQHGLTASGGSNKITYNFSYTYNNEKAIVLNSNYLRQVLNGKLDYNVTKNIKVGVTGRYTDQNVYGAGISTGDQTGSSYSRLRNAVKYRPFLSSAQDIDDQDPIADPNAGNGLSLVNPIALSNAEYRKKSTGTYNATAYLNWNILKHLTFRSTFGYNRTNYLNRQYSDSITPYSIIAGSRKPIVELDTNYLTSVNNSNVLTWSVNNYKNKHTYSILVGEETYDLKAENHTTLLKNIPTFTSHDDAFQKAGIGEQFAGYPKLYKSRYTSLSFFGRISYSYKDKYLFSGNLRYDGSSKFAPGKQWGVFPSGSIAWRVSQEGFMKNIKPINDLKIRFGYGRIGNNRITDYLFLPTFSNNGNYYYGLNGQTVYAYYQTSLPNPNLKWESNVSRNLGLDAAFLKNRLSFSLDIYSNTSSDLLLNVPIAPTYGYSSQIQNVGKTANKGIELQLNGIIVQKRNGLNWNANFNISHNSNKVVALGPGQNSFYPAASWGVSGQPADYIVRIGDPVGSMWGLVTDGFYKVSDFDYNTSTGVYTLKSGVVTNAAIIGVPQPGAIKFKDLNGDGKVDIDNDRKIIGNPTPKFTGGLNQQFTYKNWDASLFVNFSIGGDVYNANKIEFTNGYTANSNLLAIMQDRWRVVTPDGQTAQYVSGSGAAAVIHGIAPAQLEALNANAKIWMPIVGSGAFYPSSWAIEDGSFLRFNNVTIGYTYPSTKLKSKRLFGFLPALTHLRCYATANNLAIITSYTGYDPEVSVRSSGLTQNLDYSAYPKSRTFLLGINASFQ